MTEKGQNSMGNGARLRADIVPTDDEALSTAMLAIYREAGALALPGARIVVDQESLGVRADLLESPESDPTGFERVIGESDLSSINYLDRGRRAAAAVCRIRVPSDGREWYGTGFLVGPRLLVTNHHVLGSAAEASQAEAEFAYEHDVDGVLQTPIQFNLRPHELFLSSPELDVTFVAVSPLSDGGVPIDRFGWLPLLPLSGKSFPREWVTIIQHPNGGPKQISIRASRIVSLPKSAISDLVRERNIHYLTDTEPGSSGAPVLNDQWQVVAIHHKAVPAPRKKAGDPPAWIGNEGVRVSAIYAMLENERIASDDARRVLDRLEGGLGFTPLGAGPDENTFEADGKPYPVTRWKKASLGYNPDFLSQTISLQKICAQARKAKLTAPLLDGDGDELKYNKFSVIIHAKRKFPLITAVNIDGRRLINPGKRPSTWRQDARMDPEYQPAGDFYEKAKGSDKVSFSRGHQVRRLDPSWGLTLSEARAGDADTFHYTNAAPQVQHYNDTEWGNLEDYVLDRAQTTERKLSVFTGPIYRRNDPLYGRDREGGPWRIPLSFWKIAVLQKSPSDIVAAAFIVGQTQYVQALYEAKVFSGLRPYRLDDMRSRKIQTTVQTIERETGLNFSEIRKFDAHGSLESTRRTRWINQLSDVLI